LSPQADVLVLEVVGLVSEVEDVDAAPLVDEGATATG
jgi:hypothetical protein